MSDMLIRKISPRLKRQIKERARAHGRSMSEEAKELLQQKVQEVSTTNRRMGTELLNLLPPEYRGDDLVFEIRGKARKPPDFK